MPTLQLESYSERDKRLPQTGRQIIAQYDRESIVVYQAYAPAIGHYAATHGSFGGDHFSFSRMSWIKPSFLWMIYRSGWGTKLGQEVVLAVWMKRIAFDEVLRQAIPSSYPDSQYAVANDWRRAVQTSDVRVQWDPDRTPNYGSLERRAIQLGLRRAALERYAREWINQIEDISDFVATQRAQVYAVRPLPY